MYGHGLFSHNWVAIYRVQSHERSNFRWYSCRGTCIICSTGKRVFVRHNQSSAIMIWLISFLVCPKEQMHPVLSNAQYRPLVGCVCSLELGLADTRLGWFTSSPTRDAGKLRHSLPKSVAIWCFELLKSTARSQWVLGQHNWSLRCNQSFLSTGIFHRYICRPCNYPGAFSVSPWCECLSIPFFHTLQKLLNHLLSLSTISQLLSWIYCSWCKNPPTLQEQDHTLILLHTCFYLELAIV